MHSQEVLILVVEDDQLLQALIGDALSDGGFNAFVVPDGDQALAHIEEAINRYQALVTDINLPGPDTGWDVAKRARELRADIPVVYMTGAAADQWSAHGVPGSVLLHKPFAPAQLVTAVAQLLNRSPARD